MPRFDRQITEIHSYRPYDKNVAPRRLWDATRRSNGPVFEECTRVLKRLMLQRGLWPLTGLRVIDLDCGSGRLLQWLIDNGGLEPANAVGIGAVAGQADRARTTLPDSDVLCASADALPFAENAFDVALAFTLLGSLVENDLKNAVVGEIQRILVPDGFCICYDFRYVSLRNCGTRPVTKRALRRFFPGWTESSTTLTLLPCLRSTLAELPLGHVFCRALASIPFLRSHRLTCVQQPRQRSQDSLRIAWICSQEKVERNRAATQRLLYASKHHVVYLYGRGGQAFLPEIVRRVHFRQSPALRNLYLSHALFYGTTFIEILFRTLTKQIQVVYTTVDYSSIIGFVLRRLTGVRWVADMLDDPMLEVQTMVDCRPLLKYILYSLYCRLLRRVLRYADAVPAIGVTLEEGLPKTLTDVYKVPKNVIIPVSNGVDLSKTVARPTYRMPDRFMVLYLGGIAWVRGLDTLIQAAAFLKPYIPSLAVSLVGPYRQKEDIEKLKCEIDRLDLTSIVRFIGKVSHQQALDWMASADVCVVILNPNIQNFRYTFSVKLFEYLALGRAVVAPDLPGVRYVVRHRENGYLYEPGNATDLSRAVLQLYADSDLKKHLESAARDSVLAFDWHHINKDLFTAVESRLA